MRLWNSVAPEKSSRKMEALPFPVEILIELVKGDPERSVSFRIPVTVLDHLGRNAHDPAHPHYG